MKRCLILPLLLLAACSPSDSDGSADPETEIVSEVEAPADADASPDTEPVPPAEPEEIATELDVPWSINKSGDDFYISERPGTVAHISPDGTVTRQQVAFSQPISSAAEAGFLGFLLKSDFEQSQEAYAYYVFEAEGASHNRIVTLTLEGEQWEETDVHLNEVTTGPVHHGGRLEYSPDGEVFVSIGDAYNPDLAQDPDSLNGKILQLREDGDLNIYSSGHRNPQGFAWSDGVMYAAEHGESANDEINRVTEGANYGWPIIEGTETQEGYETPFYTTGPDETWAPSGIAAHNGRLYVASLRGTAINIIDLETGEHIDSIEGYGRVRDVLIEDGILYFVTNNTDGRGSPDEQDDKLIRYPLE